MLGNKQKVISPTRYTPKVILDRNGSISLEGRLIPEDAIEFFDPICEWINVYFKNPAEITNVDINLDYVNSAGSKYLLDMIRKITDFHLDKNSEKFRINWYYMEEDEDALDQGELYSSILGVPFNYIMIP